jgi:hypothetical protein
MQISLSNWAIDTHGLLLNSCVIRFATTGINLPVPCGVQVDVQERYSWSGVICSCVSFCPSRKLLARWWNAGGGEGLGDGRCHGRHRGQGRLAALRSARPCPTWRAATLSRWV